jgi:MFS transporter, DHA1 family, tetracycline resistance protein
LLSHGFYHPPFHQTQSAKPLCVWYGLISPSIFYQKGQISYIAEKQIMASKRPAALLFIFITLLIDVMGLGIIIPVLPKLLSGFLGNDLSEASRYGGYLMFSYAAMQFVFSPVIGGLSDRFGRRPVILASLFGFGIDYLILAFAPSLFWLFVGRIIAGITGASFTTAGAYIADVSAPEDRAKNFGLIGAAFGLGFIIGPALGGILGSYGERVPFFVSAGLTLLNWLYGYFVLPESLKPQNRRAFDWKRANPIGSLLNLARFPVILGLSGALICLYIAGQVHPSTWSYFTMKQFGWNETQVGISLAFVGLMAALVQGGLNRILIPKLGERRSVIIGLLMTGTGFFLFGLATQSWMMYAFMVPFALGGIAGPALQGIISKQVGPSEQGELQGTLTSLMSASGIVGPALASQTFAYFNAPTTLWHLPGAAFFTFGSLLFVFRSFARNPLS